MSTEFLSNRITQKIARAGRKLRPYGEHTIRVALISAFVLVLLLEINQIWSGVISNAWDWIWNTVLAYKTVNFGLGLLTCYLLMRHSRVKHESGIYHSIFKDTPLKLDLKTLEAHARKMGIELHLTDDPRIMKRNTGLPMDEGDEPVNPEEKK